MQSFKLLDTVALLEDLPEEGLMRGQIGAIVEVYPDGEFEVEFVDTNGQTYAQLALQADQLMRLRREPTKRQRELEPVA